MITLLVTLAIAATQHSSVAPRARPGPPPVIRVQSGSSAPACVIRKIETGNYSSFDNGESVKKIALACIDEFDAYVSKCVSEPPYKSANDCSQAFAIMVQLGLKYKGY